MGIIDQKAQSGLAALGISTTKKIPDAPQGFSPDFPEGLEIIEIVKGRERPKDRVLLIGSYMPVIPFQFGGTQHIVKDYYPGNSEPVVQVMGPREGDVTIKGKLKTRHFDVSLEGAASNYQELIDGMRIRGNVVKITLGEWRRYGFIEEATFRLNRLSNIEYEIKFSIIGVNPPKNCKFRDNDDELVKPNKELTNAAAEALAKMRLYPPTLPRSIADVITDAVDSVARQVSLITNFVDGALADVTKTISAANKAIGLMKNARAFIARTQRTIGNIALSIANLGKSFADEAQKTSAAIINASFIGLVIAGFNEIKKLIAALQRAYSNLINTVPFKRHLVRQGDNLQRLSMAYYSNQDNWKKIYDHNRLTTTQLAIGTTLEIPRIE